MSSLWLSVFLTISAAQAPPCAAYDCALALVERGDATAAIRALNQVLATSPGDLKALNLLGIALTSAGKTTEANAKFAEALETDPTFYPARKNLAINEFNAGHYTDARRHFDRVLESVPDDPVTHAYLGEIEFARKAFAAAIPHYERAGTRVSHNPLWLLDYASCLLAEHRAAPAIELLERLPDDPKLRFDAGVVLARAGAPREAARFFASARSGSDAAAAGYNQALMLVEAGAYDESIAVLEDLITHGTASGDLYNLLGRAHAKAGHVKEAYDALRAATRVAPENEDNYVDLAAICVDHQNYDLGLEIIDVGLQYRPKSALLHLQRGVVLAMRAELGPAEQEFDTAHRLAPDQPAPYAGLAMIWMQTGQTEKAVDVLRNEARHRTTDHVVPYIFAVALMRSGLDPTTNEAGEALDALRASVRANPDFAPARSELGRLLLKRDDVDGAIGELEKAVALDAGSTAAIYNLAQAYRKKGDKTRAADLLARLTKLNAQERGDDPTAELKRMVVRIVREGSSSRQ